METTETNQPNSKQKYKFSNRVLFSFTLGVFLTNIFTYGFSNIQYYYNSVLLLDKSYITIVMLIYAIFDGINDPVLGWACDKSKRFTIKWGKRFPWIIMGISGVIISSNLLFFNVGDPVSQPVLAAFWMCLMLCVYDFFLSLHDLNFTSLYTDKFRDPQQRNTGGVFIVIVGLVASMIASVIGPGVIQGMIDGGQSETLAWRIFNLGLSVIGAIIVIFYIPGAKETKEMKELRTKLDEEEKSQDPFFTVFKRAIKHRNFVAYIIIYLSYATGLAIVMPSLTYWVTDGMNWGLDASSLPSLGVIVMSLISLVFWAPAMRKLGTKMVMFLGMMILGFACIILYFLAPDQNLIILPFIILGIGLGAAGVTQVPLLTECIDEDSLNNERRNEGAYSGINVIFNRLSYILSALIFLIVDRGFGYVPEAGPNQSETAVQGLRLQLSIIPGVISIVGAIIFFALYKLSKEEVAENAVKLKEKGL